MVEALFSHLLVECAALVAGAVLAQVLRWVAARLGTGPLGATLPAELTALVRRLA
jgi:hypothetical protein